MSEFNYLKKYDEFWMDDITILFRSDRLIEFYPNEKMSYNEKLNAVMRFSIYLTILLFLFKENYLFFYIIIFVGVLSFFLKKNFVENFKYFDTINSGRLNYNKYKNKNSKDICQLPSINNPFMNILHTDIKYRPQRPKACEIDNDIKKQIEDNFDVNLYKNISDVYGNTNSQRQYYTMPSTTIPNDQHKFSEWLYGDNSTCKIGDGEKCISNLQNNILADKSYNNKYF